MSNNNLVQIADILIEIDEKRKSNDIPKILMSRYPEGSKGIIINGEQYVVLNNKESDIVNESQKVNKLKDEGLKYSLNFYLGTHKTDEPDIIDDSHNKSKLINEAYTEVSFLPKDILSQANYDKNEGKKAIQRIIDKSLLCDNDFVDFKVDKPQYASSEDMYDEIYRCRCIFTDISGNKSVDSLLIKAFKVSDIKGHEYSYKVIDSGNIKDQVEELENRVENDNTMLRTNYSNISDEEYEKIKQHIQEGISNYYEENSNKFYRLIEVDVKAIYCLRLKKNQVVVNLLSQNDVVATYNTYYSMVAGDLNVFTCPTCNNNSDNTDSYDGMKIHIDYDYSDIEGMALSAKHPIGCTSCMVRCHRCGSWHFKLDHPSIFDVKSNGFYLRNDRKFLENFIGKKKNIEELCSCRQNLSWIYDDMSRVDTGNNKEHYYKNIVDKFLSNKCKLVFVNSLSGEVIAEYDDFVKYLHDYLYRLLKKRHEKVFNIFINSCESHNLGEQKNKRVHAFIDYYLNDRDNEIEENVGGIVKECIEDFKEELSKLLNISRKSVKTTDQSQCIECSCCGGLYYKVDNTYFNDVKNMCNCCAEATRLNLKYWERMSDGVVFYKNKDDSKPIRTFQSNNGEIIYDDWLKKSLKKIASDSKETKRKEVM